jgi:hypothetical protein
MSFIYSYQRQITVTNSNSIDLYNYQAWVVVDTATLISNGKMRPDCGDVVFTDANNNLLDAYVEPGTCNTTSTRFFVAVPYIAPQSSVTLNMYYGNPAAVNMLYPYNTLLLGEDPAQFSKSYLYGSASYMNQQYIRLVPCAGGQWGGVVGRDGANPVPAPTKPTGLYAKFNFYITSCSYPPADAVWLAAYDSTYLNTDEDTVQGGYHFTFDYYQSRICFTKSTNGNDGPVISCYSTSISQDTWHTAEVYFWYDGTNANAQIYYDGTQVINAQDTSPQSNVVNGTGIVYIAARNGGSCCESRLGGFVVVKWYPNVSTTVGDEVSGTFMVNPHQISGTLIQPVAYGTRTGTALLFTGRRLSGYFAPQVLSGSRTGTALLFTTSRTFSGISPQPVRYGYKCSTPSYTYLAQVYNGNQLITSGRVYLYLANPKVYTEAEIINGLAMICIPLTPNTIQQATVIVVDSNLITYLASISNISPLSSVAQVTNTPVYTATVNISSQLALPTKFTVDITQFKQ